MSISAYAQNVPKMCIKCTNRYQFSVLPRSVTLEQLTTNIESSLKEISLPVRTLLNN